MNQTKKPLISLFIINLFASSLVSAIDFKNSYGFRKMATSLCERAASDQPLRMRSILRKANTHIRTVYLEVDCNGQSLLEVATTNQSKKVSNYLKRKANPEQIKGQAILAKTD